MSLELVKAWVAAKQPIMAFNDVDAIQKENPEVFAWLEKKAEEWAMTSLDYLAQKQNELTMMRDNVQTQLDNVATKIQTLKEVQAKGVTG